MKCLTGNPFIDATGWRPPNSSKRFFDSAKDIRQDFEAWQVENREREEKIKTVAASIPEARAGFYWRISIAPRVRWTEQPIKLAGDELITAIVTLSQDDENAFERIINSLKQYVFGADREVLIAELSEVRGESIATIKERILAYKPREIFADE